MLTRIMAIGAGLVLLGGFAACSDSTTTTTPKVSSSSSSSAACQPEPAPQRPSPAIDLPALPPLPDGSYVVSSTVNGPNSQYVIYVPQSVDEFHQYTLDQWPAHGVVLGGGDRESFEVEVEFTTPSSTGNAKARARQCDANALDVTIGLTSR